MRTMSLVGLASSVLLVTAAAAVGLSCADRDGKDGGSGISSGTSVEVGVYPNPVTFPAVFVGTEETRVVTIGNIGLAGTLVIESVTLEAATDELTVTGPAVLSLEAGESTTVTVFYRPLDEINDSGKLLIQTNATIGGVKGLVTVPITLLVQSGELEAIPKTLDFGAVPSGTTAVETVTFTNQSTSSVQVQDIYLSNGGSADFGIPEQALPDLPFQLAVGDTFPLDVSYAPLEGGADSGKLVLEHGEDGDVSMLEVLLTGAEISAGLTTYPSPVDFGWRMPDQTHQEPLTLGNQGALPLEITAIYLADWSDPTVGLDGAPAESVSLGQTTDVLPLTVTFTPTVDMQQTTAPIAAVVIESNDPRNGGTDLVSVYGRAEAPSLQVNPPESVDFGFVAQNLTTLRKVALYNAGNAPLTVQSVVFEDNESAEFEFQSGLTWGPTLDPPVPAVIEAQTHVEVPVLFTNLGADSGTEWAKLRILSNDGQTPDWPLDLKAARAGAPTCKIEFVPSQLDFGIVPRGMTRTMTMKLVNTGSGNCSFNSALANDCPGFVGMFSTSCGDPSATVLLSGDSSYYSVVKTPLAIQEGLKPGQSYDIDVMFTPPETAPIFGDEMTDFAGLLGVRIIDPYVPVTPDQPAEKVVYPQAQASGIAFPPNLHAKSGFADLSVFPQELDFSVVTIGCHSQTLTLSAYNVGTAPLDLTDWELKGCSPEFLMKEYPGLPKTLDPQKGVEFKVAYVPQDEGDDTCTLELYTNDSDTPAAVVVLKGGGTYESEWTDEFIQTTGQDVDVLFVVDCSGSMSEEQDNLAKNFKNFISEASTWKNDYRVGLTSCDTEGHSGQLLGTPRWVDSSTWASFTDNVKLGTNCSGTERGLAAAQMALSLPNTADSTVPCTTNADCTSPEGCYEGFCGGPNRGFLRKDATLEVVFVSDEEDQSSADLAFYVNFFKNIKGFYNSNLFHAHAIVGPSGGCSSSAGDAVAGNRYIDIAKDTGGNFISICEPDFASGLKSIGEIAFGLKAQFFLTRTAEPSSIEVKVADVPCPPTSGGVNNWAYDAPSNSVVFNEAGACMPQPGELVWIHYEMLCLLE